MVRDIDALARMIGAEDEASLDHYHEISLSEQAAIGALCLPPFSPDPIFSMIGPWSPLNDVPYLVHTGFELPLMLDGRKPFAAFSDAYPSKWFDDYLAPFEPHVTSGTIVRRVVDEPMPQLKVRRPDLAGIRHVYFALPDEVWRIDAYRQLEDTRRQSGWSDVLELRLGQLLGYEDWQNEWWMEHRRTIGRSA
ncbi:MAG: hypothetical protein JWL96_1551 [Sphingomonas bacterium]|nr:hypothetical protein [Sphingomonas bacterium]